MANFTLWLDNDACPRRIRDIIFKAAQRLSLPIKMVANTVLRAPGGVNAEIIVVGSAFDAADDHIATHVQKGDLVITADIPLADRVVTKGATALTPRGVIYTESNIKEALSFRNLSQELRSSGEILHGPPQLNTLDINKFAAALDKTLVQLSRAK